MEQTVRYWGYESKWSKYRCSPKPVDVGVPEVRALILELLGRQRGNTVTLNKVTTHLRKNSIAVDPSRVRLVKGILASLGLVVVGRSVRGREHYRIPTHREHQ